jgi:hypothetical protein
MKGSSQMGQPRIVPHKEVYMRQDPSHREKIQLFKDRWRFLANLTQPRNHGIVCRPTQHKWARIVGLEP